jgi:dihydrodipicolinate synthase/N-acetylneuraminate lyase
VEETRLRPGLSVPVVTVLDPDGALIEAEQRAVVRHVVQDGYGADVVFAAGTTGEWDRVENAVRQRVVQICTEEVAKANASLGTHVNRPVEAWAGVTAPTARETLENLDSAIACGADVAVLAPLSIEGLGDPVRFVVRDVSDLLDARPRRIPVVLYDNADIAADPRVPHIRTRQVKAMSRLDFVRGVKVSAPRRVLGHYTQAAAGFRQRGEFGIYVGNAMLIFELFRPHTGWLGAVLEHWNRYRLRGARWTRSTTMLPIPTRSSRSSGAPLISPPCSRSRHPARARPTAGRCTRAPARARARSPARSAPRRPPAARACRAPRHCCGSRRARAARA